MDGIENLDIFLKEFFLSNSKGYYLADDIDVFLLKYCETHKISQTEFDLNRQFRILEKLRKDEFIGIAEYKHEKYIGDGTMVGPSFFQEEVITRYYLTFDSEAFVKEGGYNKKILRTNADNNRLQNIVDQQLKNQRSMNLLTLIIAIGTTVAAIYYLKEFFCPH